MIPMIVAMFVSLATIAIVHLLVYGCWVLFLRNSRVTDDADEHNLMNSCICLMELLKSRVRSINNEITQIHVNTQFTKYEITQFADITNPTEKPNYYLTMNMKEG